MKFLLVLVFLLAGGPGFAMGSGGGGSSGSPTSAQDWYNQGYNKSQSGDYAGAMEDLKQAISKNPSYAEAYNMLGFCSRKLGKLQEAFAYYDKALKIKPYFPEAWEYYGEAYLQDNNLTKAVQFYVALRRGGYTEEANDLLTEIDHYVNKKK